MRTLACRYTHTYGVYNDFPMIMDAGMISHCMYVEQIKCLAFTMLLFCSVYPDVPGALRTWKGLHTPVYIYSSGSVEAQKLLFGYSEAGNLLQVCTTTSATHTVCVCVIASCKPL